MLNIKKFIAALLTHPRISGTYNVTHDTIGTNANITNKSADSLLIKTVEHTSKTGRIEIYISHALYTSGKTSNTWLTISWSGSGLKSLSTRATNVQPSPNTFVCDRITHHVITDVPRNTKLSIMLWLGCQDATVTATIPAYRSGPILIKDI